jgi:hypothetical protein
MKLAPGMYALLLVMGTASQAQTSSYPSMAPIDQYRMTRDAEIEMARSAAPESVSRDAEILVLAQHGLETAVKGKNGFVCLVMRSWAAGVDEPEFWNPKVRAPICLNAAAARSYLPHFVKKTEWVLAGLSKPQVSAKLNAAFDNHELTPPEPGAMCYMMSKQGHLSDRDGHWHPHLMFFAPATDPEAWGANLPASPLLAAQDPAERLTIFLLPVDNWSDGTPGPTM